MVFRPRHAIYDGALDDVVTFIDNEMGDVLRELASSAWETVVKPRLDN